MPPCSLISSTRSIMPRRSCLPKPASGPERSWIEPTTISVLLTPCCSAAMADAANEASKAATAANVFFMRDLLSGSLNGMAVRRSRGVHRLDAVGVFGLDEPTLQLHRRRELFVFGAQLGLEEPELLDLLDARELDVDARHFGADQLLHFLGARQAGVVAERNVVVLGEFLDIVQIDHDDGGEVGAPVADDDGVGDVGRELELVLELARRHVLAAGRDDDVLHAIGDPEIPVAVLGADIAGV